MTAASSKDDEQARIYFDGVLVDENGLETRIGDAIAKDATTRAIITAAEHLNYGRVLHVIDVVKGAGIEKFALNIRPNGR